MLTDPNLRSQIDALWDKLWTGGLSNPLDAIEQLSFLLFLKRLDEAEQDRERDIRLHRTKRSPIFPDLKLRWSYWTNLKADEALKHVKEKVFPFIKTLGGSGGSFAEQMANAEFKIKSRAYSSKRAKPSMRCRSPRKTRMCRAIFTNTC